mgnify:CR=1 FL=1
MSKFILALALLPLLVNPVAAQQLQPTGNAYSDLVSKSCAYLKQRQDALEADYHLSDWPRWDWNQETGQLVFSRDGEPGLVADIQFVGDLSIKSNEWLWAWANPTIDDKLKVASRRVRLHGRKHSFSKLIRDRWPGTEVDGWEMTAVAAYLLKAKGAYRTPDESGLTYLLITDIRLVVKPPSPGKAAN